MSNIAENYYQTLKFATMQTHNLFIFQGHNFEHNKSHNNSHSINCNLVMIKFF